MPADVDAILGLACGTADAGDIESQHMPNARALRRDAKRVMARVKREQALTDVLKSLPRPGESVHILSGAKFDFWTWIPACIGLLRGKKTKALYASTWTLSRPNAAELFELMDAKKIKEATILTGIYFKRRETAVFATLLAGLRRRAANYRAFENHAKVTLLDDGQNFLTIEGSANLTANPRWEQYVISNDRRLWEFHREWFLEMLRTKKEEADPADLILGKANKTGT